MINRLISLIRKEFIQIVRDPRALAITFIMPVMMLILLGYAATNDVRNIALAVLDWDQSPASRSLIAAYKAADYFQLAYVVSSEEEMRRLIDNNSARWVDYPAELQRTGEQRALCSGGVCAGWLRPNGSKHRAGSSGADWSGAVHPHCHAKA